MSSFIKVFKFIFLVSVFALFFAVFCQFSSSTKVASASTNSYNNQEEILVSSFFANEGDTNGYIYTSVDGKSFQDTAGTYKGIRVANHACPQNQVCMGSIHTNHRDPSIMFYQGYFWMISGFGINGRTNTAFFNVNYSKDLVHWSDDTGIGIKVNYIPYSIKTWFHDGCAPEWFLDKDGKVYILLTAGDMFSDTEINLGPDGKLYPYIAQVTQLTPVPDANNPVYLNPPIVRTSTAKRMPFATTPKYSQRDSFIYQENGNYYFYTRLYEPYTVQVWTAKSIYGPWSLLDSNAFSRNESSDKTYRQIEAQGFVKFRGKSILYTDKYDDRDHDLGSNGGIMQYSESNGFTNFTLPTNVYGTRGLRHGTVINPSDAYAKKIAWAYRGGYQYRTGDVNGDGDINTQDYLILKRAVELHNLLAKNPLNAANNEFKWADLQQYQSADINKDGIINDDDIAEFNPNNINISQPYLYTSVRSEGSLHVSEVGKYTLSISNPTNNDVNNASYVVSASYAALPQVLFENITIPAKSTYSTTLWLVPLISGAKKQMKVKLDVIAEGTNCTKYKECSNFSSSIIYPSKVPSLPPKPRLKQRIDSPASMCDLSVSNQRGGSVLTVCPQMPKYDGGSRITSYTLRLHDLNTNQNTVKVVASDKVPYSFKDLTLGHRYEVFVSAKNSYGSTSEVKSSIVKVYIAPRLNQLLQPPRNVQVTFSKKYKEVYAVWEDPSSGESFDSYTAQLVNIIDKGVKVIDSVTINSHYHEALFSNFDFSKIGDYAVRVSSEKTSPYNKKDFTISQWTVSDKHHKVRYPGTPFTDFDDTNTHTDAILWLYKKKITLGVSSSLFGPNREVNRSSMAVFMYKIKNKPKYTKDKNHLKFFKDITNLKKRKNEIYWLVSKGITQGSPECKYEKTKVLNKKKSTRWRKVYDMKLIPNCTFKPADSVSRGAMAVFLWRLAGAPTVKISKSDKKLFSDIKKKSSTIKNAIIWLKKRGVTTTSGKFKPDNKVTRAQMASFLMRFSKKVLKIK